MDEAAGLGSGAGPGTMLSRMEARAADGTAPAEGLRERKKRLMRRQLSDTATEMFLERGFDAVRVSEVAEACGVSEKTVFNYFPTKESLLLDRWEGTVTALRAGLAEPGVSPVEVSVRILADELNGMTYALEHAEDPDQARLSFRRFGALIHDTPSLQAQQRIMMDQVTGVVAQTLAERAGISEDDPEPQIAAAALLGLWQIHFQSLRRHLGGTGTPAEVRAAVTGDVQRAARLIDAGLRSFPPFMRG